MSDIEKQHNSIFEQIRRIDENGNEFGQLGIWQKFRVFRISSFYSGD